MTQTQHQTQKHDEPKTDAPKPEAPKTDAPAGAQPMHSINEPSTEAQTTGDIVSINEPPGSDIHPDTPQPTEAAKNDEPIKPPSDEYTDKPRDHKEPHEKGKDKATHRPAH